MTLGKKIKTWFGFPEAVDNLSFFEEIDLEDKPIVVKKSPAKKKAPAKKAPAKKKTAVKKKAK
jgi:hypothetical protein